VGRESRGRRRRNTSRPRGYGPPCLSKLEKGAIRKGSGPGDPDCRRRSTDSFWGEGEGGNTICMNGDGDSNRAIGRKKGVVVRPTCQRDDNTFEGPPPKNTQKRHCTQRRKRQETTNSRGGESFNYEKGQVYIGVIKGLSLTGEKVCEKGLGRGGVMGLVGNPGQLKP